MRTLCLCVLVSLAATSATAQVQVDIRLEKDRYLVGEPIVVRLDVRNVGDEAVANETLCSEPVRLEIVGVARREPPNIFGCFMGTGFGGGCGAIDHPPMIPPGQTKTLRYLLKDYDLPAGRYRLSISGTAPVRWKYYPTLPAPNLPPPPPPRHRDADPVEGAKLGTTVSVDIVRATPGELRAAFGPFVSDADGSDWERRALARAAIVDSALPFLEPLLARFASEASEFDTAAIEALGRIASPGSRTQLKNQLRRSGGRRSAIVLALARIGHRDDAEFFVGVLQDQTVDDGTRGYAALGLGRIGGARAVRDLERAIISATPEVRRWIVIALGNTRSRAAVPILIGLFGEDSSRDSVCGALATLTHRAWCDGTADDTATRRRWQRWWGANASRTPLFGSDSCPVDTSVLPELSSRPTSRKTI